MSVATKSLGAADLHTLNTVPVELIPAPEPTQVVTLVSAWAFYTFGTTPYNVGGDIQIAPLLDTGYSLANNGSFSTDALNSQSLSLLSLTSVVPDTVCLGSPLVVVSNGSWGSFGDGTLLVRAVYATLDTA